MIPKIIHYCWFGKGEMPTSAKQFIKYWHTLNPEYAIIRWDESNFPYDKYAYSKEAYDKGKFAFVSDVARLYALYEYGGIYLDTDVEAIKNFDDLLGNQFFMGYETGALLSTAIIGSTRHNPTVSAMLNLYNDIHFDNDGVLDQTTNVERLTSYIMKSKRNITLGEYYFDDDIVLYPTDYFSPKSYSTGDIKLTKNSYVIHHFNCSWYSLKDKTKAFIRRLLGPKVFYMLTSIKNRKRDK